MTDTPPEPEMVDCQVVVHLTNGRIVEGTPQSRPLDEFRGIAGDLQDMVTIDQLTVEIDDGHAFIPGASILFIHLKHDRYDI